MDEVTTRDLGEYCRRVEDHLTRANAGHLVRIVGPGFELVRRWAESGVPLSVVYRGIDLKTERHRNKAGERPDGGARRPLRIEFCESDVQATFDHWRRAVGVAVFDTPADDSTQPETTAGDDQDGEGGSPKRRSLSRHLDRAIDRLSRASSRVDMPEGLRTECARILEVLAALKESSARLRGAARDEAALALIPLDDELAAAARQYALDGWMDAVRQEAASDLAPFRARLAPEAWDRSIEVTIDRLLRTRFGLPTLQL